MPRPCAAHPYVYTYMLCRWVLAEAHAKNKTAIAGAHGIAPLVDVLREGGSVRAQTQAADALAAIALDNEDNQLQVRRATALTSQ